MNKHIGTSLEDVLKEEGILESATEYANSKVAEWMKSRPMHFEEYEPKDEVQKHVKMDMNIDDEEKERRDKAGQIAHEIVMTVSWPWTEREKHLWYIGVLADTGWLMMDYLENATLKELEDDYRSIYHSR